MLEPLTPPRKQPSAPSPLPFQTDHGNISNFESINFLIMPPLTLMSKFDIIQAKCTYGFNQTPLISMNKKLSLATVVPSTFLTNQNYQTNQMILHQNSTHQFLSTAKSSTLSCNLFNNMKLSQVSSTSNMMCPFAMPYMKWATSKVQHQLNLTTLLPTA